MSAIGKWVPGLTVRVGDIIEPRNKLITMYKCTASVGALKTGLVEPVWTDTITGTHTDGGITWECVAANYIEWSARHIYKTNVTEPTWPTTPTTTVVDAYPITGGAVTWKCRAPAIIDTNCPQSTIAFPMSQKVFSPGNAADDENDVVRYCATNAPKDWTTPDDAGFLPTGQHSPASVDVTAIGEYRGRMVVWTPSTAQIWTTDPDPAEMSLFDSIDGIGVNVQNGHAGVAGDLFFCSPLGIRTLSVAAGSTNLAAGDVGTGIDELVRGALVSGYTPIACYYPGAGQYWAIFPGATTSEVYVYSIPEQGKRGSWSRYVFPWVVTDTTQLDGLLYLRAGDVMYRVDETKVGDEITAGVVTGFEGRVRWPYLDLGTPGANKMLHSIDISAIGQATVSIAYDPNNGGAATTPYAIGSDTIYGTRVPIGVAAPQMSVRLAWPASNGTIWQLNMLDLIVEDMATGL